LGSLLLQVLLIDGKLFSNLWTWLSSQEVLKLNIELLLLLDDDILLHDFFGLLNQSLLESLNLLKHFPSIWIGTLELSPSVAIQWVLKLFGKGLNLKSLGQKLLLEVVDLLSQVWDLRSLRFDDSQLTLVISDLEFQKSDILESLLILDLTSCECALKNLDLFIEESQLIISSNKLSSEDISLIDDVLVILLQSFDFLLSFLNDVVQLLDFVELLTSEFLALLVLFLTGLDIVLLLLDKVLVGSLDQDFLSEGQIFGIDVFLELRNLMGSNLELSLQFGHYLLSFDQVRGREISIRSNRFI